ncbi:S1 RNA binding domain-containing protein [Glycomyces harbinensis]|uniref:S1 RNA binding domain-containing protein n=1 Tax=Glycomyces harbinensis TaxID=58114 RepID=A0A1G6VND4_9ACTN|nr:S1 RNA binding domain-containing protein [Glycomyces harbinensis]
MTPFGVFVRISDCVEGLIALEALQVESEADASQAFEAGRQVRVRLVAVDLVQRRIRLALSGGLV